MNLEQFKEELFRRNPKIKKQYEWDKLYNLEDRMEERELDDRIRLGYSTVNWGATTKSLSEKVN